jgi:hypothetical protein
MNKYSLRKFNALCKAAVDNDNEKMKRIANAVRWGMNASADEFRNWLRK